mmetsp:Transcript_2842/g.7450  ORF Transcript_2842/g.7450 Transcript_2842/m.7450 type:complete len:218 (-) Transcript_2842:75-728(-)
MASDDFFVAFHVAFDNLNELEDSDDDDDNELEDVDDDDDSGTRFDGLMNWQTCKFRRPAVRVWNTDSEGSAQCTADRKNCSCCDKVEALTRTFAFCAACKIAVCCSKKCQKTYWQRGHKHFGAEMKTAAVAAAAAGISVAKGPPPSAGTISFAARTPSLDRDLRLLLDLRESRLPLQVTTGSGTHSCVRRQESSARHRRRRRSSFDREVAIIEDDGC